MIKQLSIKYFIQLRILFQQGTQRGAYDTAILIHNNKIHSHPILKLVHSTHGICEQRRIYIDNDDIPQAVFFFRAVKYKVGERFSHMGDAADRAGDGDSGIRICKIRICDQGGDLFILKFPAVQLLPAFGGKEEIQGSIVQINAVHKRERHELFVQCTACQDGDHGIVFLHI